VIVVVLAAVAAVVYVRGRDGAPGTRHWIAGSGPDRRLELTAIAGPVEPLHARHVDLMSLQVAQQPEELRRFGAVVCKLHHDALPKGTAPTTDAVRTVACQRTSPALSVVGTDPGPGLEHHPEAVARMVDRAYERLS
jgi:hypothetical protein